MPLFDTSIINDGRTYPQMVMNPKTKKLELTYPEIAPKPIIGYKAKNSLFGMNPVTGTPKERPGIKTPPPAKNTGQETDTGDGSDETDNIFLETRNRNALTYGLAAVPSLASLFQRPAVVPGFPSASVRAPHMDTTFIDAQAEQMKKDINSSLNMNLKYLRETGQTDKIPGLFATHIEALGKLNTTVLENEMPIRNQNVTAEANATNQEQANKTQAEIQRLQVQLNSNALTEGERAKAMTNLTQLMYQLAANETQYADSIWKTRMMDKYRNYAYFMNPNNG